MPSRIFSSRPNETSGGGNGAVRSSSLAPKIAKFWIFRALDSRAGFEAFGWGRTRAGRDSRKCEKTRKFPKVQEMDPVFPLLKPGQGQAGPPHPDPAARSQPGRPGDRGDFFTGPGTDRSGTIDIDQHVFRDFLRISGSRAGAVPSLPWAGPSSSTLPKKVLHTVEIRGFCQKCRICTWTHEQKSRKTCFPTISLENRINPAGFAGTAPGRPGHRARRVPTRPTG